MKTKLVLLLVTGAVSLFGCGGCEEAKAPVPTATVYQPVAITKTNATKVYVHYMPWFDTNETTGTGKWGYHWTMNNQNPDIMDANGKRQIASHYYPLIGTYASNDPDLIEYHLLLMKYAGIDGVLIDWYGSYKVADYYLNKRNTEALVAACDKVGMQFAIVYEDRTVPKVMTELGSTDAVATARGDMLYLKQNFFTKSNYIKIDDKPLLMVFGPDYVQNPDDWTKILSIFSPKPCFLSLWGFSSKVGSANAGGEYLWPWGDNINVDVKYADKTKFSNFMGGAWPGFHDFYKEGGAGNNLFVTDYANGAVWKDLLAKSQSNAMNYLQLITWNDFGEGTMIEPTQEFRYSYLAELQKFVGAGTDSTQLKSIYDMYTYRKKYRADATKQAKLNQAFYYFVSMQDQKAIGLVNEVK